MEAGLPDFKLTPSSFYDSDSIWWTHERLSRKMLGSFKQYFSKMREQIEPIEGLLHKEAEEARSRFLNGNASSKELERLTYKAFEKSLELEKNFINEVKASSPGFLFGLYWKRVNSEARIVL
jgi:hypothetical protein